MSYQQTNKQRESSMKPTPAGVIWSLGLLVGFLTIGWISNNNADAAATGFGFFTTIFIGMMATLITVFALALAAAIIKTAAEWIEAKLNGRSN